MDQSKKAELEKKLDELIDLKSKKEKEIARIKMAIVEVKRKIYGRI